MKRRRPTPEQIIHKLLNSLASPVWDVRGRRVPGETGNHLEGWPDGPAGWLLGPGLSGRVGSSQRFANDDASRHRVQPHLTLLRRGR